MSIATVKVLDDGFVSLLDKMGSDRAIAEAAWVSMDACKDRSDTDVERVITYLAKHEHWCYDDKTEVFTNRGWLPFSDLNRDDLVAEVTNWNSFPTFKFVKPLEYHANEYDGFMYYSEGNAINYCVTPGHRMLVKLRNADDYEIKTSDDVHNITRKTLLKCAVYEQSTGVELDYYHGFYFGFMLGDGCRVNNQTVKTSLKVQRKVDAFRNCLLHHDLQYTEVVASTGATEFNIRDSVIQLNDASLKTTGPLLNYSFKFLLGLFDGLMTSNGSKYRTGFIFTSTSKQLVQDVSMLAVLLGKSASIAWIYDNKDEDSVIRYRTYISTLTTCTTRLSNNYVKPYKGIVYCVTVPSGMLLVRRNGKQLVCGNTPMGQAQVKLHIKMPIYIARQYMRSNVGIVYNEISRRYVDKKPEFHCPARWRKRPDKSIKQGSGEPVTDDENDSVTNDYLHAIGICLLVYDRMIKRGIAPELARIVLPVSCYTEVIASMSIAAAARVHGLRVDPHAQQEIQEYAKAMDTLIEPHFPITWKALKKQALKKSESEVGM